MIRRLVASVATGGAILLACYVATLSPDVRPWLFVPIIIAVYVVGLVNGDLGARRPSQRQRAGDNARQVQIGSDR